MRLARWALILLLSPGAAPSMATAQQGSITGRVIDEGTRQPLSGARVQVSGTSHFALSNAQGTYTIRGVAPGTHQLRIILIGYASVLQNVTVPAGGTATADWAIRGVPFTLEEIVTTATGEQLTRELGNNIGRISTPDLVPTAPITNLQQLLSGRVAGVNVLQSNGVTGQSARIRVRGISSVSLSNDPVVYIDGIRVASESPAGAFIGGGTTSHLSDLNPEEIESIEIVKGPSAATLYGTQAANGVIRVTTKRGRPGAPQWSAWLEGGLLKDTYEYPSTWFSKAVGSEAPCFPWQDAQGLCEIEQLYQLSLLENPETTPFGTGNRQQAGLSVTGGTEAIRYFVSGEWERELGLLKLADTEQEYLKQERGTDEIPLEQRRPNELRKFSGRVNLSTTIAGNLDVSVSSGYIDNDIRLPQTGDNFQSIIGSPILGSANPSVVAVTGGYGFARPADALGEVTWRRNDHFTNSVTANWRARPWLTARGTLGLDYLAYVDEQNVFNGQGCKTCQTERQGKRQLWRFTQSKYSLDANGSANWRPHTRVGARTTAGLQYNFDDLFGVRSQADILPPGSLTLTAGAQKTLTEETTEIKTFGYYLEQQFSLDDRLYLIGAVRVDANSAFGQESRSATYPKVSGSWVAMEGRSGWLNDVRVRAAYGVSGQQPGALAALTYDVPVTASVFGSANTPGAVLGAQGDIGLKPERSSEIEAGVDVGLFGNRLRIETTVYNKSTDDALVNRNIPLSLGTTASRIENIGTINNKGIEVSVNARIIENDNLTWDLQLEGAGNKNRLKSLGAGVPPLVGFGFKNIPGYPMFGLWWQDLLSYDDANGDGFIDPTEVVVSDTLVFLGSTVPTRTLTATNAFSLLGNRLSVMLMGEYKGGYVTHNVNGLFLCAFQVNCRDRHDPGVSLEAQAKAVAGARAFGAYAEDGSFFRLREASVTYHAPASIARIIGARSGSVTFSARNVFMITGFDSWDPENVTQSGDASNYNFFQLRQPLYLVLRFNLGF